MIIGNGLIASLFKENDREEVVFFASGVSNSLETRPEEFLREENLLKKTLQQHPKKKFLYFSTCSIYDSSKTGSDYVLHKLKMEQIVKSQTEDWLILRVSNAVGKGGNPNLLMNYLSKAVRNSETVNVHTNAARNLIDAEDVKNIVLLLIDKGANRKIINVAYPENFSVIEILEVMERFYKVKLSLNLIRSGSGYQIEIPDVEAYFRKSPSVEKQDYIERMLQKYYPL